MLGEVALDAMEWAALEAVDAVPSYLALVEAWAGAGAGANCRAPCPVEHLRAVVGGRGVRFGGTG